MHLKFKFGDQEMRELFRKRCLFVFSADHVLMCVIAFLCFCQFIYSYSFVHHVLDINFIG